MKHSYSGLTVAELVHQQAVLQDYLLKAVVGARRSGSTWAAIGVMLGTSTQEAHRRYAWTDKFSEGIPDSPTGPTGSENQ